MSLIGKATENGLREVAQQVLAPHFHTVGSSENKVSMLFPRCAILFQVIQCGFYGPRRSHSWRKQFAIRPNIRNNSVLTRDLVIQLVAQAVGPGHKVDLKQFDVLILVEVYKNICGMSVVGGDFDTTMRRYNLDELSNSADKAPAEQSHSSCTTDGQR
jgi:tRNA acetyltransferase TAN1